MTAPLHASACMRTYCSGSLCQPVCGDSSSTEWRLIIYKAIGVYMWENGARRVGAKGRSTDHKRDETRRHACPYITMTITLCYITLQTCSHMYTHACIHPYTYTCTYMHACMHTDTHMHAYIHAYRHTYVQTHTYIQRHA